MPSYVLRLGRGFNVAQPQAVAGGSPVAPLIAIPEMVGRSCRLEPYEMREIPRFRSRRARRSSPTHRRTRHLPSPKS